MALDRIGVYECYFAASGMAGICPVAGFEQNGSEEIDFDHLARYSIDLHPIAHPQPIFPHQYEPAEESDYEILQRHSQSGASKAENRRHLTGSTQDHKEDQKDTHGNLR